MALDRARCNDLTQSNSTGGVDSVLASRHGVLHRPAVMLYHTCHIITVPSSTTRAIVAAVLLELSGCAATITVVFPTTLAGSSPQVVSGV